MPKYYLALLDYFPSFLHFLTSLITFSLTKVFLQRIGGRPGWGSILEGLIELNELKNAQVLGELKALLNVVVNSFCCKWQFTELPMQSLSPVLWHSRTTNLSGGLFPLILFRLGRE